MSKVLEVRNLRVSFRTNNGNVKAVRDISFDLEKGETLAIVGESGSGKSVTAKSILGINAANTIIEGGEIIYHGEDLLKYSEKEFNKVRGNDLTMIFQDPLSSLDPIMKIGKQMTEATLLNNKTRRKNAKKEVAFLEKEIESYAKKAGMSATPVTEEVIEKAIAFADKEKRPEMEATISVLQQIAPLFEAEVLNEKECRQAIKKAAEQTERSINKIAPEKNSNAYTFRTSMMRNLDRYVFGCKNNPKEEARVKKETAHREQSLKSGKHVPKVVPANLVDLKLTKENMQNCIKSLLESYSEALQSQMDYKLAAKQQFDHLEQKRKEAVTKVTKKEAYAKAIQIMKDVGIKDPERRFNQYPHEFSGGMRQRIVIAIAIAANPEVLLCDEPTTALDVTIQAQILELINDVKEKRGISVLFITHDLGVVANMADKVAVMYAGKIVEYGTVEDIFYDPKHPYTWALLSSMPSLDTKDKLEAIPGTPPNMIYPPKGDAFAERNKYAMAIDFEEQPPMFQVSDTHYAATWLLHPDAPKIDPPKSVTDRIQAMRELEKREAAKEDE